MQDKNFEHQVKDLLYNHEEAAPNVMNNVFEKRTPLYVFKNKLILNKYKLIAAAALIGVLAFLANYNLNRSEIVEPSIETVNEQPAIAQSENQESAMLPAESSTIDIQHTDVVNDVTANKSGNVTVNEQKSAKTTNEGSFDNERTTKQEEINQMPVDSKGRNYVDQNKAAEKGKSNADWNTNKAQNVADASIKDQGELKDNTLAQQANDEGVAENDNNNADRNQENISTENETDNTVETKQDIAAVDESTSSTDATNATDAIGDEDFGLTKTTARNWSVSLNTIIGSGSRNLDQSGDIATVVVRDNTESNQLSYGTELLLNYRLLDNLEAFGGVGFFNRRESMNY